MTKRRWIYPAVIIMELPEIHIIAEDHFIRSYPMNINAALDMLK